MQSQVSVRASSLPDGGLGVFTTRLMSVGAELTRFPPENEHSDPDYCYNGFGGNRIPMEMEYVEECGHMANDGGYYHWSTLVADLALSMTPTEAVSAVLLTLKNYNESLKEDNNSDVTEGVVVAMEELPSNTEVLLSYGFRYWLCRLPKWLIGQANIRPAIKLSVTLFCSRILGGWYERWPNGFYLEDGILWTRNRRANDDDCKTYGFRGVEDILAYWDIIETACTKPTDLSIMIALNLF